MSSFLGTPHASHTLLNPFRRGVEERMLTTRRRSLATHGNISAWVAGGIGPPSVDRRSDEGTQVGSLEEKRRTLRTSVAEAVDNVGGAMDICGLHHGWL